MSDETKQISTAIAKLFVFGRMTSSKAQKITGINRVTLIKLLSTKGHGKDSYFKAIESVLFMYRLGTIRKYLTKEGRLLNKLFWAEKALKKDPDIDIDSDIISACTIFRDAFDHSPEIIADADFYQGLTYFDSGDFEKSIPYFDKAEETYKNKGNVLPEMCAKSNRLIAQFRVKKDANKLVIEDIELWIDSLFGTDGAIDTPLSAINLAELCAYGNSISQSKKFDIQMHTYLNLALDRCKQAPLEALFVLIESDKESPLSQDKRYIMWKNDQLKKLQNRR